MKKAAISEKAKITVLIMSFPKSTPKYNLYQGHTILFSAFSLTGSVVGRL